MMTQQTLFPEKWLLKLNRRQQFAMSGDDFFATIIAGVLLLGFLLCYIGSYASEIGYRIPMRSYLERQSDNIEMALNNRYTKAILLKYKADRMVVEMDRAYDLLCTPLDYGKPSNDGFYDYDRLMVE